MEGDEITEENENDEVTATPEEGNSGQEETDDDTDDSNGGDDNGESKDTDDKEESGEEGNDDIKDDDPKGVKKRIGKVTKARRTAERENAKLREENAYLKGLAEGNKKEAPEPEPEVDVAPVEEDYEEYTDFLKAVAEHSGKVAVKEAMAVRDVKDKAKEAETTKDTRKEAHQERVEAAKKAHPDYEEKVFADDGSVAINQEMYENIIDSEKGAEVAYYLAEHPDEARAIYDLDDSRAVSRAMGRIEDKVKVSTPQKTKKSISKAPPPIAGSKGGKTDPAGLKDDMPIKDWMKGRNAEVAASEGRG